MVCKINLTCTANPIVVNGCSDGYELHIDNATLHNLDSFHGEIDAKGVFSGKVDSCVPINIAGGKICDFRPGPDFIPVKPTILKSSKHVPFTKCNELFRGGPIHQDYKYRQVSFVKKPKNSYITIEHEMVKTGNSGGDDGGGTLDPGSNKKKLELWMIIVASIVGLLFLVVLVVMATRALRRSKK